MNQFTNYDQGAETSSHDDGSRFLELADQSWNRNKSAYLARNEGISLNDEHWAVIVCLRRHYLEHGLPRNVGTLAKALDQQLSDLGGSEYLNLLFPGGPVTQGSRLANLSMPDVNATGISFGRRD
ncbi:MAG: TusE/DsrC/DsvC family sulfur relay protein [Pseudomonadota bacterium]